MAFRGIFDGSVEIEQAREARAHDAALQRQRIAAQMAMQTQQLQAQANAQRAQLQAGTQQANADRELKQQQFAVGAAQAQQQIDMKRQEFDSGAALREMQQENAKLMLQQAQAEFDEDQAQRATLTQFRQSAFGAGLITAALNGVAPTATLSRINQANGIADGDPGSVIGIGGGPEGLWYDVIAADEQGKMGKKRQEVDPMTLLAVAHSIYGEKGASDFIQMYKSKDTNNTRMNIAFDKYLQSLEVQKLKNEGTKEVAGIKSDTTLAVEDKKTDRAMRVQELKNQVGGVLGISAAKVNLPSAVKTLTEQLDNLDAEIRGTEKRKQPLDPKKVKRREDVQKALDNVLGMLGDDGAETAGAQTGAQTGAPTGRQPTGGTAQIPGVPQERQVELRAIAERAMATANGDKAKAEKIFNAEVAKRYPDLVPATQPSPGKVPEETPPNTPDDEKAPVSPFSRDASPETAAKRTVDAKATAGRLRELLTPTRRALVPEEGERKPLPTAQSTGPRLETAPEGSAKIGPEKGTLEYLQGMPKGKAADLKGKEIGTARREILKRLEAAYRLPKSDEKVALVKRLRAELDEFNQKYRP